MRHSPAFSTRRKDAEITVSLLQSWRPAGWFRAYPRFTAGFRTSICTSDRSGAGHFKSDVSTLHSLGTGDWKGTAGIKLLDEEFFPVWQSWPQRGRLPKDPASMLSQAAAESTATCRGSLVQVCRFEARSRYRRHFIYRYERADGGRRDGTGHCARSPVGRTIGHSGGKTGRLPKQPARCLLPLRRFTPLLRVQPGPGGFSGLAG